MFAFETISALHTTSDSPSPVSEESFPTDDQLTNFEEGDDLSDLPKRKSRRPPSTAERRATHNAVERARRESLNGRFMDLAAALPNMATVKRPSKSVIVAKSLEYVQGVVQREQAMVSQNEVLRQELNELRARLGMTPVATSPVPPAHMPLGSGRPREHSIISSDGSNSLIGTPPSNNGSFDSVASSPAMLQFPQSLPGFGAPYGSDKATNKASAPAPQPVSTASFGQPGMPVVDMNYLMALSMQHQQQQNLTMMNLQNRATSFPPAGNPWGMPHGLPVSAGGPDTNWLFA